MIDIGALRVGVHRGLLLITPFYNPAAMQQGTPLVAPLTQGVASLFAPSVLMLGDAAAFTVRVRNSDSVARTFFVGTSLHFARNGVQRDELVARQEGQSYQLAAGETRDFSVSVPWSEFAAGMRPMRYLRAHATVVSEEIDFRWSRDQAIGVSALPVTLGVTPSGTVRFNDLVNLDLRFRNTAPNGAQDVVAEFGATSGLRYANNSTTLRVPLGNIESGGDIHTLRAARLVRKGPATVTGRVLTANANAQSVGVQLTVVGCLGDLDGGDSVDDADFSLFVQSYDALLVPPADPASDLNRDGLVDDSDFMLFVQAYNQLACD